MAASRLSAASRFSTRRQSTSYRQRFNARVGAYFIALVGCGLADSGNAATLTEHMEIGCTQQPIETLTCNYRLRDGGELTSSVAELNGQVIVGRAVADYPTTSDSTVVMLLVDTSDPARQATIDVIVTQIDRLLAAAQTHQQFGLATFDTDLYLLADIGTPIDVLRKTTAQLRAKGKTTELYRNVREAVRLLARNASGTRRALIVLSDGLAEDYAYHHEDVVKAARDANIAIHSVGYPRSVAQSVALQTLRRLSDETGGLYIQADHVDYSLPAGIFARMITATESGGALEFDLSPLFASGISGVFALSLAFQTSDQSFIVLAPVRMPDDKHDVAVAQSDGRALSAELSPAEFRPTPEFVHAERADHSQRPWFVTLIILILLTLVLVLFALRRVRKTIAAVPTRAEGGAKPLAFLVMRDRTAKRHIIDKTPWRIGRGRNNDLTIFDHSVSRLHAEIRTNDQGQLLLKDLESLNGVFVNDNRIDSIQLREGDAVDIGDVRMGFTLHDEEYAAEDPTVLVRTHTPL